MEDTAIIGVPVVKTGREGGGIIGVLYQADNQNWNQR
jgi:hypothetical protein